MNNQLVSEENISKTPPQWPRVNIPGNAVQGSILLTVNQFVEPPQDASNLKWLPMEDIIGTANVKMEYDEKTNLFNFYKAKGHLNNDKNWVYEWTLFATIAGISEEVQEELKNLIYVSYRYDTSIPNSLVVYGIKKDGVQELLCNINFVSSQEFAIAVNNLSTQITGEITRATNRENQIAGDLNNEITRATNRENEIHEEILDVFHQEPGTALDKTPIGNYGGRFNVLVDDDNVKVNNNNQLTTDVFDDTQVRSDKGWSSAKITQQLTSAMTYEGQVATYNDLPTGLGVNDKGKTYNVEDTGDNYTWNGTSWDKLSGEYIAGVGIVIQGKVISASGISFIVGDGLKTTGSGEQTTLSADIGEGLENHNGQTRVKLGQGMMYDATLGMKVKAGGGITVDNNGVNVKANEGITVDDNGVSAKVSNTTKIENNNIEVNFDKGLTKNKDGKLTLNIGDGLVLTDEGPIKINANFAYKDRPLGDENSKLTIFSDRKVAVDFTESPVVLTTELLIEIQFANGTNFAQNINIPNYSEYDMFAFEPYSRTGSNLFTGNVAIEAKGNGIVTNKYFTELNNRSLNTSGQPTGMTANMIMINNYNYNAGTIGKISRWVAESWVADSSVWSATSSSSTNTVGVRIYGIKAR